jgi:hypothetical protein
MCSFLIYSLLSCTLDSTYLHLVYHFLINYISSLFFLLILFKIDNFLLYMMNSIFLMNCFFITYCFNYVNHFVLTLNYKQYHPTIYSYLMISLNFLMRNSLLTFNFIVNYCHYMFIIYQILFCLF